MTTKILFTEFPKLTDTLLPHPQFEKVRQEKLKYISLIGSVIGAVLGIIATSINHSIRQRDLANLSKSLQRQVDQDKEINFYTAELKKIVDDMESRLHQTPAGSSDQIANELRALNDRLSSMEAKAPAAELEHALPQSPERRLFGVLYASLVLYLFYRIAQK